MLKYSASLSKIAAEIYLFVADSYQRIAEEKLVPRQIESLLVGSRRRLNGALIAFQNIESAVTCAGALPDAASLAQLFGNKNVAFLKPTGCITVLSWRETVGIVEELWKQQQPEPR